MLESMPSPTINAPFCARPTSSPRSRPGRTGNRSSDDCACGAAPHCANADRNNRHSDHDDGPGVARNIRSSRRRNDDRRTARSGSLGPDSSRGPRHYGVRGIHGFGCHGDRAQVLVEQQRRPARQPCLTSFSSFLSPRLAVPGQNSILEICVAAAERRPNVKWVHGVRGSRRFLPLGPIRYILRGFRLRRSPAMRRVRTAPWALASPCHAHGDTIPAAGEFPQSHSPPVSSSSIALFAAQASRRPR